MPEEPSDGELLRRMKAGDEEAFAELYRRRQSAVYRFALQMTGSVAVAEDVTQEVFLHLIRSPQSYNPARGPLAAYLYGLARNHVLRVLEKNRRYAPAEEQEEAVSAVSPVDDLARRQTVAAVRRAILALPAPYREAVVLCDMHGLSYEEAAEAMGRPVGTVRSRLHRARALLLERLENFRSADVRELIG